VDPAKKRLTELEMPIPEADPRAVAHMKYEKENRTKLGLLSRDTQFLKRGPDVSAAAKSGMPTMTNPKQSVPLSVPSAAAALAAAPAPTTGINDVTIAPVTGGSSALDTKPDARTTLKTDPTAPAKTDASTPDAAKPEAAKTEAAPAAKTDQTSTTVDPKSKKKKKKPTKPEQTIPASKTTANQE
jgi:outer membrane protein assembly factor BamD